MELGGLENVDEWIVVAAIFGFIAILLILLVRAKGSNNKGYSDAREWPRRFDEKRRVQLACPTCQGAKKVKRELPPMQQNSLGVYPYGDCPTCKGKGWVFD